MGAREVGMDCRPGVLPAARAVGPPQAPFGRRGPLWRRALRVAALRSPPGRPPVSPPPRAHPPLLPPCGPRPGRSSAGFVVPGGRGLWGSFGRPGPPPRGPFSPPCPGGSLVGCSLRLLSRLWLGCTPRPGLPSAPRGGAPMLGAAARSSFHFKCPLSRAL